MNNTLAYVDKLFTRIGMIRCVAEPKGFVRLLQFPFLLLAIISTFSHSDCVSYELPACREEGRLKACWQYPFRLHTIIFPNCSAVASTSPPPHPQTLTKDSVAYAQFFMTVTFFVLFYNIAMLSVMYGSKNQIYSKKYLIPATDYIITLFLAIIYLFAAGSFTYTITELKDATSPSVVIARQLNHSCSNNLELCKYHTANFGGLHAPVLCSVVVVLLSLWSLWFIFKETYWFVRPPPLPNLPSSMEYVAEPSPAMNFASPIA